MRAIVISALIFSIAIGIATFLFFTAYRSAFEADQACHFAKLSRYYDEPDFGCDHDLETRQWILFRIGKNAEPAKVIKRYRY